MNTPILNRFFDGWAKSVFGPDYRTKLSALQLAETERAFMSGFASYYFFTMEAAAGTDDEMLGQLAALEKEIKQYFANIKLMPRTLEAN